MLSITLQINETYIYIFFYIFFSELFNSLIFIIIILYVRGYLPTT